MSCPRMLHEMSFQLLKCWERPMCPEVVNSRESCFTFLKCLVEFLRYKEEAVSVRLGRRVPKHICQYQRSRKNNPGQWKYLCIEGNFSWCSFFFIVCVITYWYVLQHLGVTCVFAEPFDLTNTARSVYDASVFDRVKLVFKNSYEKLQQSKMLNCLLNS